MEREKRKQRSCVRAWERSDASKKKSGRLESITERERENGKIEEDAREEERGQDKECERTFQAHANNVMREFRNDSLSLALSLKIEFLRSNAAAINHSPPKTPCIHVLCTVHVLLLCALHTHTLRQQHWLLFVCIQASPEKKKKVIVTHSHIFPLVGPACVCVW